MGATILDNRQLPTLLKPQRVQIQNGVFGDPKDAITRAYFEACGVPHIINGFGGLKDNTNFPAFTFDPTDLAAGFGSFKRTTLAAYDSPTLTQLLAVDPNLTLKLRVSLKAGNSNGTEFNALNVCYAFINALDVDGFAIDPINYTRFPGATDTTLAAALNYGDTTISLTNATGWANGSEAWYAKSFAWYPYTNSFGYSYPAYTYTRLNSLNYAFGGYTNPLWASGGISGNTITLRGPWTGPNLASGTKVRNHTAGGTYVYYYNGNTPNDWIAATATLSGINGPEELDASKYRPGTAFLALGFLFNYHGTADTRYRVSAFSARYA